MCVNNSCLYQTHAHICNADLTFHFIQVTMTYQTRCLTVIFPCQHRYAKSTQYIIQNMNMFNLGVKTMEIQ